MSPWFIKSENPAIRGLWAELDHTEATMVDAPRRARSSVFADDFASRDRSQVLIELQIDGVPNESDRAVDHQMMGSTRVPAARRKDSVSIGVSPDCEVIAVGVRGIGGRDGVEAGGEG